MDIKQILEQAGKDILTEETLNSIQSAVNSIVEKKVAERTNLVVESALEEQDEKHGAQANRMIKAIDEDHTKKMVRLAKAIEENHKAKLKNIQSVYEKKLFKKADIVRDQLVESISSFLDNYVERKLPRKQIQEAAKANYLKGVLDEARSVLGVDDRIVNENFKSAIKDGAQQIESLRKENQELKKTKALAESKRLIAEKTANMPKQMAEYVRRRFEGKSPSFIKENFSFVVKMFNEKEEKQKFSVVNESRSRKPNVDFEGVQNEDYTNNQNLINEEAEYIDPIMASYLDGLGANRGNY